MRLLLIGAMGAMLITSLAVPHAFGSDALIFGIAYFAVRAMHLAIYAYVARAEHDAQLGARRRTPGDDDDAGGRAARARRGAARERADGLLGRGDRGRLRRHHGPRRARAGASRRGTSPSATG